MRVLQLLAGCQVGGLEVMALALVERLHREIDFDVVCYDDLGPLLPRYEDLGVPVTLLQRRMGVDVGYPFRLARHIRRRSVDVVHAHNNTALFYGAAAALACGGRRVVFTAHDRKLPRLPGRLLQRGLGRVTTRAVAVSEAGRNRLLGLEGFRPSAVRVIRNGADERQFEGLPSRQESRAVLGIAADAEVVGTVARMYPEKNLPLLVRAFARVAAERRRAVLVVAGDGPDRPACERLARELGVEGRIHFLGTRSDVARILSSLDVFVLSSRTEGLPVAVVEAMAAECPVVATDVGAVRELVRDGHNGWLVPSGGEVALADRVLWLLTRPEDARAMGARGAEVFRASYTLERMAAEYGRLYREATEGVA